MANPTTTTNQPTVPQDSPFQNYREVNGGSNQPPLKRIATSVEGKTHSSSETQEVYMSLERKSAKKQQFIDMSGSKRENNFSKAPLTIGGIDPKSQSLKMKSYSSQNVSEDPQSSDKFRKATLSPPQSQKDNMSAKGGSSSVTKQGHKVLASTLSKTKKISYIKSLVKKSQQKSLSRDFNSNQMSDQMFASHGSQSNLFQTETKQRSKNTIYITNPPTISSMDKMQSSLSPNKRTPTHQAKKHASSKNNSKGRKDEKPAPNMLSIQLLKPPIKNNMQSLFQPNSKGKIDMLDCPTPTVSSLTNGREFNMAKDTSINRSINSNNRCSTQERVKMDDESLRQINNQLESSQRTSQSHLLEEKVATSSSQQSMSQASQSHIKVKKNNFLSKDQITLKSDSLTSTLKSTASMQVDILEKLRINSKQQAVQQTQPQQQQMYLNQSSKKQDNNSYVQLKNQIDLIKNTCEAQINQINFTPIRGIEKSELLTSSARQNQFNAMQAQEGNKITEEDFGATTLASSSRNEIYSNAMSWRNKQIMQQKMTDLEKENKMLKFQVQQQQQMITDQQSVIETYKTSQKKKCDAGVQANIEDKVAGLDTEEITDLLVEIESLRRRLNKMEKRIQYHKNKENKFLFFLFTLQNKGIPVNELYEKEGIKDIATSRFADIMAEDQQQMANNQSSMMFSFYSDDSYEPLDCGPDMCTIKKKPPIVPRLDLENLPEYESSEDEGEEEEEEVAAAKSQVEPPKNMNIPQNDTLDYQKSIKYIENYYNQRAHRENFMDGDEENEEGGVPAHNSSDGEDSQ